MYSTMQCTYLDSLIIEKFICSCVVIIGQAYNPIVLSHTTTYMMYIVFFQSDRYR